MYKIPDLVDKEYQHIEFKETKTTQGILVLFHLVKNHILNLIFFS